ncbi:MAG: hypothetical protein IJC05_06115 [Phascolarctobacterium sp.]|nr:hypothetical protein [Phascolarctobacterium sp.]
MAIKLKTMLKSLEQKERVTESYRRKLDELRELRKEVLTKLFEAYYQEKDEAQRVYIATHIEQIRTKERNDNQ